MCIYIYIYIFIIIIIIIYVYSVGWRRRVGASRWCRRLSATEAWPYTHAALESLRLILSVLQYWLRLRISRICARITILLRHIIFSWCALLTGPIHYTQSTCTRYATMSAALGDGGLAVPFLSADAHCLIVLYFASTDLGYSLQGGAVGGGCSGYHKTSI